jgi:DNA polymerase-3 subunit alpha
MTYKEIKNEIINNLKIKNEDILQKVITELDFLETSEGLKGKNNLQDFYDKWQKNKDKIGNKNNINSWTAYSLEITTQKPTGDFLPSRRYFARPGPPDIDTDFDYEYQHIIYQYIIDKYGRDFVSNVGTHGVLKLRSAITRICKVLDIANAFHKGKEAYITENQEKVKEILNEFPKKGKFKVRDKDGEFKEINSVEDAYKYCKDFKYYLDKYPDIKKYAKDIEGITSNFGRHAAAIVVSDIPIYDICPRRSTRDGGLATQFAGEELEKIGLIKFDILAISTLTAISKTLKYIKNNYGINIDIENLPLDDKKTLELYRSGKLLGVFQCETYPMQKTMMDISVDRFEDIAVAIALFRPGPMASIPEYCNRKKGISRVNYFHSTIEPFVKPYLEKTYGIIVAQEQVMQICNSLAGFTIFEGYDLIKSISKKKAADVVKFTKKFIVGCIKNGVPENIAEEYWKRFIVPFSGYGFNFSHSLSYSLTSYISGYLKANYTEEFMCAYLNAENERKNHDKIELLENDLKNFDIELLPKKINSCGAEYHIVKKKNISQGITKSQFSPSLAVKGVGKDSAIEIEKHAPYKDLKDLAIKTDSSLVNQEVIGALIDFGFFDDMITSYNKANKKKLNKEAILEFFASIRKDIKTVAKKGGISEDLFG